MNRLGQMLIDEGMEKGIKTGIEKGIELSLTNSIKKLMKNTNLTIDQVMDVLEVPQNEREKYRQAIVTNN